MSVSEQPPTFEAVLRGVQFRPIEAKAIVKDLEDGNDLILEREPTNPHDPNAIRVLSSNDNAIEPNCFIGYVAKEVAVDLAPWMDKGWHFTCVVNGRMSTSMVIMEISPILPTAEDETVAVETGAS